MHSSVCIFSRFSDLVCCFVPCRWGWKRDFHTERGVVIWPLGLDPWSFRALGIFHNTAGNGRHHGSWKSQLWPPTQVWPNGIPGRRRDRVLRLPRKSTMWVRRDKEREKERNMSRRKSIWLSLNTKNSFSCTSLSNIVKTGPAKNLSCKREVQEYQAFWTITIRIDK